MSTRTLSIDQERWLLELVRSHTPILAWKRRLSLDDAKDVMQEVCAKLLAHVASGKSLPDDAAQFKAYVCRAADNEFTDRYRRARREDDSPGVTSLPSAGSSLTPSAGLRWHEPSAREPEADASAERVAATREQLECVHTNLRRIEEESALGRRRVLVLLLARERYSAEEIVLMVGFPSADAARQFLHAAWVAILPRIRPCIDGDDEVLSAGERA